VLIIDKDVDDFVADESVVERICQRLDEMMAQEGENK
jgi:hypothetical protein